MATLTTTAEPPEPPMPPHLRRVLDGLDRLIAKTEATKARWAANGEATVGDRRATALAALVDERLALLRASRQGVLADSGRRGGAGRAGGATPVADDALP
jgi:hypothetical protein